MGLGVRDCGTRIPRDPRESQLMSGPGSGRERDPRPADGMGWESRFPNPHGMGRDGLSHVGSQSRIHPVTIWQFLVHWPSNLQIYTRQCCQWCDCEVQFKLFLWNIYYLLRDDRLAKSLLFTYFSQMPINRDCTTVSVICRTIGATYNSFRIE